MAEIQKRAGAPIGRESWSGKWMFILAAAGSAVGLGNMWRFPYLDAKYGGGTFLIVYIILVFTVGVSLLLQDIALGRHTQKSIIGAFREHGKTYGALGYFAAAVPFLILPYYFVIGGWVCKYGFASIADGVAKLADGGAYFTNFITGDYTSFLWMLFFGGATLLIVSFGVKGGIEKVNLVLMPLLIVMSFGIAIFTLTIPGALDGLAFYVTPDFSKLSPELILAALGQCFFSLSIAMAIMVTYGSYTSKEDNLTQSVSRIAGFDLLIGILAGMMVVPGAYVALGSAEAVAAGSGPSLMFVTLPNVFANMGAAGSVVSSLFFVLTFFAALTSAISIAEACVSIVRDAKGWSRRKATIAVSVFGLGVGLIVDGGYNVLSFIEPLGPGSSILDLLDFLSNTVMMPLVCIITCIFVGWIHKPQFLIDEIKLSSPFRLEKAWAFMIRWVCPILVACVMIGYVLMTFGLIKL